MATKKSFLSESLFITNTTITVNNKIYTIN